VNKPRHVAALLAIDSITLVTLSLAVISTLDLKSVPMLYLRKRKDPARGRVELIE
jgi:hypothetical protein